jgi:hypothetical protein
MNYSCLVTSHGNAHLSGVAKFNLLLAHRLSVPRICIQDFAAIKKGPILLSFKLNDQSEFDRENTKNLISYCSTNHIVFDVFFHTFDGSDIENTIVQMCRNIYCGNSEIFHAVGKNKKRKVLAWCPALVDTDKKISEHTFNIFSFGMAHKIHVNYYTRLFHILEEGNIDYTIWVSTAFHEKANFGDFNSISDEMNRIFGDRIQFLGFLSDSAVNYFLDKSDLFVAFFNTGVRANNTSVHAALDRGCAILTNCDEYSPEWIQHGRNVLDIRKTQVEDLKPAVLAQLRKNAPQDSSTNAGWENLVRLF